MIVDPAWAERNIGFDPAKTAAPAGASAYKPAAVPDSDPDNLQREIIDLDSEGSEGAAFLAFISLERLSIYSYRLYRPSAVG
jgi:hypothetical protein